VSLELRDVAGDLNSRPKYKTPSTTAAVEGVLEKLSRALILRSAAEHQADAEQ
jgi:hypothetical protein